MLQCWEGMPGKRPSFKNLYISTSNFVGKIAGYLEMKFNPFSSQGPSGTAEKKPITEISDGGSQFREEDPDPVVTIQVIPASASSGDEF